MASGVTYIAEFSDLGFISHATKADAVILQEPVTVQIVSTSSGLAAASSAAFNSSTLAVRVHTDSSNSICIAFGTSPTAASSNSMRLATNATEYFAVPLGGGHKMSAVFVS